MMPMNQPKLEVNFLAAMCSAPGAWVHVLHSVAVFVQPYFAPFAPYLSLHSLIFANVVDS